jgi:hypothetical protein
LENPKAWVVVLPSGATNHLQAQHCCKLQTTPMNQADSLGTTGIDVEVTQPFRVELTVFSNLGETVNALALDFPALPFSQLEDGKAPGSKRLRVLWNGKSQDGRNAATGAFILRTRITELSNPGMATGIAPYSHYRRIGVIREGR